MLADRDEPAPTPTTEALTSATEVADTVMAVARECDFANSCLPRSAAIHRMLRRRGVRSQLCVGVVIGEGKLHGHAWVEVGGVVVGDSQEVPKRFLRLARPALELFEATHSLTWRYRRNSGRPAAVLHTNSRKEICG